MEIEGSVEFASANTARRSDSGAIKSDSSSRHVKWQEVAVRSPEARRIRYISYIGHQINREFSSGIFDIMD